MKSKRQLIRFAEWVAKRVVSGWQEENPEAFAEIACRKLFYLGVVGRTTEDWTYDEEDGDA